MRAKLLVEDREVAYLFTDVADAHEDAVEVEISVDPMVEDWEDEQLAVWVSDKTGFKLRVVPLEGFDFESQNDEVGFVIPTPIVIGNLEAYEKYLDS